MEAKQNLNTALNALNIISEAVNDRDKKKWKVEAYIKYTEQEIEDMEKEIEQCKVDIVKVSIEDDLVVDEIKILVESINLQKETLRISEISLDNQLHLKRELRNNLNSYDEKHAKLVAEYNEQLRVKRKRLEENSPEYRQLIVGKMELKRVQINCKMREADIKTTNDIIKQYDSIQKQLLTNAIVEFAKSWLELKKRNVCYLELKQAEQEEQECRKKLLELQGKVKKITPDKNAKQNMGFNQCSKIEFGQMDMKPFESISFKINPPPALTIFAKSTFLKDKNVTNNKKETKSDLSQFKKPETLSNNNHPLHQRSFNNDNSKIRILEVKKIKPNLGKKYSQDKCTPVTKPSVHSNANQTESAESAESAETFKNIKQLIPNPSSQINTAISSTAHGILKDQTQMVPIKAVVPPEIRSQQQQQSQIVKPTTGECSKFFTGAKPTKLQSSNVIVESDHLRRSSAIVVDKESTITTHNPEIQKKAVSFTEKMDFIFETNPARPSFNFETYSHLTNPVISSGEFASDEQSSGHFMFSDEDTTGNDVANNMIYNSPVADDNISEPPMSNDVDNIFSFGQPNKNLFMF